MRETEHNLPNLSRNRVENPTQVKLSGHGEVVWSDKYE